MKKRMHSAREGSGIFSQKGLLREGVTIIEMLAALAVIGILLLFIMSAFRASNEHERLISSVEGIMSLLREARENTLGAVNDNTYGVHIEERRVVLFFGDMFIDGASGNKELILDNRVEIFDITAENNTIIFERLTGTISAHSSFSLHLKSDTKASSTVIITKAGVIYAE